MCTNLQGTNQAMEDKLQEILVRRETPMVKKWEKKVVKILWKYNDCEELKKTRQLHFSSEIAWLTNPVFALCSHLGKSIFFLFHSLGAKSTLIFFFLLSHQLHPFHWRKMKCMILVSLALAGSCHGADRFYPGPEVETNSINAFEVWIDFLSCIGSEVQNGREFSVFSHAT